MHLKLMDDDSGRCKLSFGQNCNCRVIILLFLCFMNEQFYLMYFLLGKVLSLNCNNNNDNFFPSYYHCYKKCIFTIMALLYSCNILWCAFVFHGCICAKYRHLLINTRVMFLEILRDLKLHCLSMISPQKTVVLGGVTFLGSGKACQFLGFCFSILRRTHY